MDQIARHFHRSYLITFMMDEAMAKRTIAFVKKHRADGIINPEYLAHVGRYSVQRVKFCEKSLEAFDRAWVRTVQDGHLQQNEQAPELAILEDFCEYNITLWKELIRLVQA
ncbi:hypothetical protein CI238_07369 [Colletotrichum incanum]|uniref:Uncharacterized protein n=1 Tax=Colletotrichum incanum TaxID=1573173 RepID=A0A162MZ75_COLIC|nr:hypothetical protein CI238_07369 [Colletotrichum incanum]